jgi:membrane protein implicated in regulation of membrane protease activity
VRRRSWAPPAEPRPKRPYRDTALVFGGMAIAIVLVAWATGGDLVRAAFIAAAFFVAATAWGWRRWRERLRAEKAGDAKGIGTPP